MINRNIEPAIKEISKINFISPKKHILDNGIVLFSFKSDNSPVIKLDIVFNAGIESENHKLQAIFTNALIKEAPKGMLPDETSEYFDFYGSYIENFQGNTTAGLRLYVPQRYFADVIPVFADLFKNPSLPENELEILKRKQSETLKNNLQKTKYVAMKGLNKELFGANHPRGFQTTQKDIEAVNIRWIEDFAKDFYSLTNSFIQVSGMIDDEIINLCNLYFGKGNTQQKTKKNADHIISESKLTLSYFPIKTAVQSSIYVGKNLGKVSEEDLINLSILNTVLGGYFGSRLMKNIREDKGYTYGIGSFIAEYDDCAALKITTDVGIDVTQKAIDEIYKEIAKLTQTKISAAELNLVKSFMLGDLLSAVDGVFQTSAIWEKIISTHRSKDFIKNQINGIKNITSSDLLKLSTKYLSIEGFHTVVAGKI